jgi:hypothetical protein
MSYSSSTVPVSGSATSRWRHVSTAPHFQIKLNTGHCEASERIFVLFAVLEGYRSHVPTGAIAEKDHYLANGLAQAKVWSMGFAIQKPYYEAARQALADARAKRAAALRASAHIVRPVGGGPA